MDTGMEPGLHHPVHPVPQPRRPAPAAALDGLFRNEHCVANNGRRRPDYNKGYYGSRRYQQMFGMQIHRLR